MPLDERRWKKNLQIIFYFFTLAFFAICKRYFYFLRIAKLLNALAVRNVPRFLIFTLIFQCFIFATLFTNERHFCGIFIANITNGMNLRDLIIIYLACGAPFGVYYFLQNRNRIETKLLWLKSLVRFVFWIPFAVRMVARKSVFTNLYKKGFDKHTDSDAKREAEIEAIKKFYENILSKTDFRFSVYEFREIFDRYTGLSLEIEAERDKISEAEKEIFRITNHANKNLAAVCLHRRNRERLFFHQKLARRDFFELLAKFFEKSDAPQIAFDETVKLTSLLNDSEALPALENISKNFLQTLPAQTVKIKGNEIWNPEKHKPQHDTKISTNLQPLTAATANSSGKD